MRHLKHRHHLGRTKEHREALMANLAMALIKHGRIETTLPKAKALRPFVEKLITLAKKAENAPKEQALHLRRLALARIRDKEAVKLLFSERVKEFIARPGGYTRIYKLGARIGDAAEMALICFIAADDEGYAKRGKKPAAKKVEAPVVEEAPAAVAEAPVAEEAPAAEEPKTEA